MEARAQTLMEKTIKATESYAEKVERVRIAVTAGVRVRARARVRVRVRVRASVVRACPHTRPHTYPRTHTPMYIQTLSPIAHRHLRARAFDLATTRLLDRCELSASSTLHDRVCGQPLPAGKRCAFTRSHAHVCDARM